MLSEAGLQLQGLSVGYRGAPPLLHDLNLAADAGEFICVLGRNGIGKSTLLRTLGALQSALAGHVALGGRRLSSMPARERARRIAVVLTERVSSPGLTVEDVLSLGRQPHATWWGGESAEDIEVVQVALRDVGGAHLAGRFVDDLSDGERQRVMIARALAQAPRLLLLDEITAFLDLPGRVEVMVMLRAAARARGLIVLLSSHDLDLSLQIADRIWLLAGDGVLRDGRPHELVAQGCINQAFDTRDVVFSREHGRFSLRSDRISL
jgi:iron complex transport system ATP-binding protein